MKKLVYALIINSLLLPLYARAQKKDDGSDNQPSKAQQTYQAISRATDDSTRSVFNFKAAPIYVRTTPFAIYTGAGNPRDRIAQNIEVGKSFNVIDLGLSFGRNSLRPDTSLYLEGRVTMDVANYGVFANEMTIGAGRVFDKQGSLMLELSYNIIAQISPKVGIGLTTGYYDFSNESTDASKTYYGIFLRFGIMRTDQGGLLDGVIQGRSRPVRVGRPRPHHVR